MLILIFLCFPIYYSWITHIWDLPIKIINLKTIVEIKFFKFLCKFLALVLDFY